MHSKKHRTTQGRLRTTKEAHSVHIPDCRLISAAMAAGSYGLVCNCLVGIGAEAKGKNGKRF
jgi:hypothetical protein